MFDVLVVVVLVAMVLKTAFLNITSAHKHMLLYEQVNFLKEFKPGARKQVS